MLTRIRFRSVSRRNMPYVGIGVVASLLIGIGAALPRSPHADDTPPPVPPSSEPERLGEEIDIFKERARENARQERLEAKANEKKIKKKAPPTVTNMFTLTPIAPTDVTDGTGMINRISHLAGKTFGRPDSITPLEVMPYMLTDEHFFFSDVRGFVTNGQQLGGNAGLGYRHLREDWNAWGGASLWYDADHSSTKLFQQIGLSFEALVQRFELRSNVYLPFGSSQTLSNTISNANIVGNQLLFGRTIDTGTALQGVDAELGYSLPIQDRHVIRGFVGGYHFEGGSTGGVNGFKARFEGVINNGASAQVLYTHDKLYGDCVMVGVSMQFPFGNSHPTAGWKKDTPSPFRFVERNYNVIVGQQNTYNGNQVATDPTTDKAYVIDQVYVPPPSSSSASSGIPLVSAASGPIGSSTNPYSSIAAAQAAGGDIILVQSGSVLTQGITLTPGEHLLGQGSYNEALAVTGGGTVQIPNLALAGQQTSNTQTPVFENASGPAITLASNNEVAGFNFSNPGGGIVGSDFSGVTLHNLQFLTTGGDAINLTNPSGNVTMSNVQINSAAGNGIVINGGDANISFWGAGTSITASNNGFVLENQTGGTIGVDTLTVKSAGGIGFELSSVGTGVTINSLNVVGNKGNDAVFITGNTGTIQPVNGVSTNVYNTYNFVGKTYVTSPQATGFSISNTDAIVNVASLTGISTAALPAVSINAATSEITFQGLSLTTTTGGGLYATSATELLVNAGTLTSVGGPAVNITESTIDTVFSSVSVNGGPYGISLTQSQGIFTILGNGGNGAGGTIENTTQTGIVLNAFGTANINGVDFITNNIAIQSTATSAVMLSELSITGSTSYAIKSLDDTAFSLANSTLGTTSTGVLNSNGASSGGTILIQADTGGSFSSTLTGNSITDQHGVAIEYSTTSTIPAGASASLNTALLGNAIVGYNSGSSIVGINWNGPVSMTATNNQFYAFGTGMTGLLMDDVSQTNSIFATVNANSFLFETGASQGTGISVTSGDGAPTTGGGSSLGITGNTVTFDAIGGTGMEFSLYGSNSTVAIGSNLITDSAGGATGMLFNYINEGSIVTISGNAIDLLLNDLATHQGIIFTTVEPTINLQGAYNNLIYNAPTQSVFSIPATTATGGFYINGTLVE